MGLVVEAYFDGREPVTLQGTNPFAGQELDSITLSFLAEWFGLAGKRMGLILEVDAERAGLAGDVDFAGGADG